MEALVLSAIEKFSLLDGVTHVTVALSGGADSMALLHILISLRERLGISVDAAHFNHCIRGEEADRDQEFVKRECERLGIELFSSRADVPRFARDNKMSLELAARKLRYEFLERVAKGVIATAHTASDSLETALFNLSRGTGIKGLCGIPAKRGRNIRPIIFCTRDDVERYCEENKIQYVTDSTNLCDDYSRNKIRHNAIPVLKSVNSSAEMNAVRTFVSLSEDRDFLESTADAEYERRKSPDGLLLNGFEMLHKAIAKRVIIRFFEDNCTKSIDELHISGLYRVCTEGGRVSLPDNLSGINRGGLLKIVSNDSVNVSQSVYSVEISEEINDFFKKDKKVNNLLLKYLLDCDKIVGKLVVRTRMTGDSIRLKNKKHTKTLKKLYNEYRVPIAERSKNPVISDDLGVVWINGIGVAHRVAADKDSRRVFRIKVKTQQGQ